jgi:predicted Fe-Mo cluster-binding NifX family protein
MIEFDFYSGKSQYASYLFIYRLQNEKYILFQKIKEDQTGYETQKSFSGCFQHSKSFKLNKIKKLSYNKIMSISNYGIRIYALDKKKEYSMVLMDIHSEGLEQIYEIDEKNLIFCTNKHLGDSLGGPAHDYLKIEKVNLINITNKDLTNNNKKEHDLDKKEESKRTVSSSKLFSFCWELLDYSTYGGYHYFSNLIILKQKYFIIMIDYYLLVFDLSTGNQLARYKIAKKGEKKLYYNKFNEIEKWNNINDNEFFMNMGGYITLFELDDTNGITLKIIAYSYFPNIRNLNKIENQNSFYNQEEDHILIY